MSLLMDMVSFQVLLMNLGTGKPLGILKKLGDIGLQK
jgi:hypothetical protein